jgi:arginase family enzyme
MDVEHDDDWPRASTWLSSSASLGGARPAIAVAGVPVAEFARTPARYELAPAAIRARLDELSSFDSERGLDLTRLPVRDLGDDTTPPPLDGADLTVLLGGHAAVTWLALGAVPVLGDWGLLTLDAHHDARPYTPGQVGNGSPVRALIDAGLPGQQVMQLGIHGFNNSPVHRDWCEKQGVTILGPGQIGEVDVWLERLAVRCSKIYVDVDMDVLDRAFAPGCPGSLPGGLTPRQLFDACFAAGAHRAVAAMDIVEVDPTADVASVTVDAAALCLLNAAAGFATRRLVR